MTIKQMDRLAMDGDGETDRQKIIDWQIRQTDWQINRHQDWRAEKQMDRRMKCHEKKSREDKRRGAIIRRKT
jgi:hypothetical protein